MLKRYKIIASIVFGSSIVLFSFQNCAKYGLKVTDKAVVSSSITDSLQVSDKVVSGSIQINNNAQYTNSAGVVLQLNAVEGDLMFVTNESDCQGEVKWEGFAKNKLWKLKQLNSESSVFVKYKNSVSGTESECLKATIIHDDIAPIVNVDSIPKITKDPSVILNFRADDALSGVKSVDCSSDTDWSSACPSNLNVLPAAEGNHHAVIQAVDKAGNASVPVHVDITVDLSAPKVEFNQTPAAVTASVKSTFSFSGKDEISGLEKYECQLTSEGAWVDCVSPFNQDFTAGANQFSVRAIDKVGNVSQSISYKWIIDLTVPTVLITKNPSSVTNSASAQFEFSGLSGMMPISSFKCALDSDVFVACNSPSIYSNILDGSHKFQVIGYNQVGTASQPAVYTWLVDTVKPTVRITSAPSNPNSSAVATFTFETSNPPSGIKEIQCNLDSTGYKACVSGVQFSDLKEGNHVLTVRAVSNAGNTGDESIHTWRVDLTPPKVVITSAPAALTNSSSATIAFTADDGAGQIARIECQLDGQVFAICTSAMNYTNLSQGAHAFQVRAIDVAGYTSAVATASWTIDNSGPSIIFTAVPQSGLIAPSSAIVSYEVSDSGSGIASVMCGLANSLVACSNSNSKTFDNLAAGTYNYIVQAVDTAGNKSEQSITFKVDPQPCVLSEQTVPVKVLFVVDTSGSNAGQHGGEATDPIKSFRTGEIQTFFDAYKSKANFSWGFLTFNGSTAKNLIGDITTTAKFSNAVDMSSAITKFKSSSDSGYTPYGAALAMSATAVSNDTDKTSSTKYIVVFISDGAPSDVTDQTILNSYVTNILKQAPGQATLSTVFYGKNDATAVNRLSSMASTGLGKFIDMNQFPQGTIVNVEDIITVPGPGCK